METNKIITNWVLVWVIVGLIGASFLQLNAILQMQSRIKEHEKVLVDILHRTEIIELNQAYDRR